MRTNTLQSTLHFNAKAITTAEEEVSFHIDNARHYRARSEEAYAVDSFDKAKRARKQLAKLVANQRAMLAELKANYRSVRIENKRALLVKLGAGIPAACINGLSSFEIEAGYDKLLSALILPKADSRVKVA